MHCILSDSLRWIFRKGESLPKGSEGFLPSLGAFRCNSIKICHRNHLVFGSALVTALICSTEETTYGRAVAVRITTWWSNDMRGSFSGTSFIFSMTQAPDRQICHSSFQEVTSTRDPIISFLHESDFLLVSWAHLLFDFPAPLLSASPH